MKYKKLFASVLIASVAILLHTGHASAATINVAAGTDSIASDSTCTLSEAIQNINDQAATNADCAAGDGSSDTIVLPSGTITLSADLPQINTSAPFTISGSGIGNSIIDANTYAVFNAYYSDTLSIHDLTIQNFGGMGFDLDSSGTASAQLYNIEAKDGTNQAILTHDIATLDLHDLYIHDNQMNAPSPQITIRSYTNANASIKRIAIVDNNASFSYDVFDGTSNVDIENMTFSHNSAPYASNTASMGLLLTSGGDAVGQTPILNASVKNSTIYNNSGLMAPPYDQYFPATGILFGSGSRGPGYGVGVNNVTLENNLFVSNTLNGNGSTCGLFNFALFGGGTDSGLTVTSLGHNYVDDSSCSSYFTDGTDKNNLSSLTSGMGSLDTTTSDIPAFALLTTSPAIDGGATVAGVTTDARGVARPQCSAYDVGAYEYNDDCSAIDNASSGSGDSSGGTGAGGSSSSGSGGGSQSSNASKGDTAAAPHTGLASASPMVAGILVGSGLVTYIGYSVLKRRRLLV